MTFINKISPIYTLLGSNEIDRITNSESSDCVKIEADAMATKTNRMDNKTEKNFLIGNLPTPKILIISNSLKNLLEDNLFLLKLPNREIFFFVKN